MTISSAFPYVLTNGTTADATQVMADFLQLQNDINSYAAPLGSPAFVGTPTAPTATTGTSTMQIATTAFVTAAVGAAALAPLNSPAFTGYATAPTGTTGDTSSQIATNAFANTVAYNLSQSAINSLNIGQYAPLNSPGLYGNPTAPTQGVGNNSGLLATTAFAYGALNTSSNGYTRLANGLIIQWGVSNASVVATYQTITFPISFPNACLSVVSNPQKNASFGAGIDSGYYNISQITNSYVQFFYSLPRYFIAIGF